MKITSLTELQITLREYRNEGKKIGLITGCFDIVHIDHILLFRFAKRHCDIVVVGLDNDESITLTKGFGRPIHKYEHRSEVLADNVNIDFIFQLEAIFNFEDALSNRYHKELLKLLKPDYIVTNPEADRFWKTKEDDAKVIGAKLLKDNRQIRTSTNSIIEKLSLKN